MIRREDAPAAAGRLEQPEQSKQDGAKQQEVNEGFVQDAFHGDHDSGATRDACITGCSSFSES